MIARTHMNLQLPPHQVLPGQTRLKPVVESTPRLILRQEEGHAALVKSRNVVLQGQAVGYLNLRRGGPASLPGPRISHCAGCSGPGGAPPYPHLDTLIQSCQSRSEVRDLSPGSELQEVVKVNADVVSLGYQHICLGIWPGGLKQDQQGHRLTSCSEHPR